MAVIGVKNDQKQSYLKALLLLFAVLIIIALSYIFFILPSQREDIYHEKMLHTKEMVDIGLSVLHRFHELEEEQGLSRPEAQKSAAEMIRSMHYGDQGFDYYWVSDFSANLIVHPFRPDLEGQYLYHYQDPEGFYLFKEFSRIAREEGAGHVTYSWQYYDQADRHEKKLSYVAAFEPWRWTIGTGVYLTDLENVIAGRRNSALALAVLFFIFTAGLVFLYFKTKIKEYELLESEEKYRLIAENTADVISILDLDLRYLYVSPAVYYVKGLTPEEAISRNLEETLTPDSLQKMIKKYRAVMDLEKQGKGSPEISFQLELEEYHKDGSLIWTENSYSLTRNNEKKPIGLIVISRDISERKRQQEQLDKEQREKLIILENLSEVVTYKDTEMRIVWANLAARKKYSKEPEEYLGEKCYEAWYGSDQVCSNCQVFKAIEEGRFCRGEVRTPDGDYWLETASPVFDDDGKVVGVITTSLDITALKKVEDELKQLNEELEQRVNERTAELERTNKELSAFTYSVSHDLRAPLRSIQGFSEAVLEDHSPGLDSEGRNYLERVISASKRMSDLIDDLLKLSRVTRQEINIHQVDISSMVEAHARYLQEEEPDRNVTLAIAPGHFARGDAALLRIALDNIISNAWKYTRGIDSAYIEFGSTAENGKRIFYIKDNGIGFEPKYKNKIFAPFQRAHNSDDYPGTGIGLSIVERIFERHRGQIWAEGEKGRGACFYFTLPD